MRSDNKLIWPISAMLACLGIGPAFAAPEEIQVYLDDLSEPGQIGVDVHNNYVLSGSAVRDYAGARPAAHVYRLTPEFYYGLTKSLELGAYVLGAVDAGNATHIDGEKLRLKYIAPHDEAAGAFWGLNLEVGRSDVSVSPQPWNAELKAIYGYRRGDWLLAFNANFDRAISGGDPVMLEIDTKLSCRLSDKQQIGFESYNELGEPRDPGRFGQRSQMLYAVVDSEIAGFDVNAGIGRGLTDVSDRWVLKLIVGHRL
jgi:hypothetical protein